MASQIFKTVLVLSALGSILTVLLSLVRPITKKYFSASWNYYMWVAVLVAMVLPVSIKQKYEKPVYTERYVVSEYGTAFADNSEEMDWDGIWGLGGAVWISGAVLVFALRLAGYIGFSDLLLKNSAFEKKYCGIPIYRTDMIDAPPCYRDF